MMAASADLWNDVKAFYGRPGVAAACLALQDEHGADVTLLLFLLARAERGQALGTEQIAPLQAAIQPWHADTIAPLRVLRRQLKLPPPGFEVGGLRQIISSAEIEAERLQILHLDRLTTNTPQAQPAVQAAHANLHAYADIVGFPASALHMILALFEAATAD
ncbi:MAG: TIGR02444 family protein [Rhodospirillales bacterium 20-58-10]|nr:MAG: TIGR02444 family protein [Rhodospirillales bacterium 20-58-10]